MTSLTWAITGTVSGLQNNQQGNIIAGNLGTMLASGTAPTAASTGLASIATLWWHDTTNNQIKLRDEADTTWMIVVNLDETNKVASFNGIAGFKNRVLNGNFGINQRNYVSGTALGAGVYGHDGWKGGSGGGTYTFVQASPDTTVTITAGTITQGFEAANIEGGTYTISWTGTAHGRVPAFSATYASSPFTITGMSVGGTPVLEFNTGTLGQVMFTPGNVALAYERVPRQIMLDWAQRYYEVITAYWIGDVTNTGFYGAFYPFKTAKFSNSPSVVAVSTSTVGNPNIGARSVQSVSAIGTIYGGIAAASGPSSGFNDSLKVESAI